MSTNDSMLVQVTFHKRYLSEDFLFRADRIYRVPNKRGMYLCGRTVNDLPSFKMVDPETLEEDAQIIDLTVSPDEVEDEEDVPKAKLRKTPTVGKGEDKDLAMVE